jgi:hypothetical protein
VDGRSFSISYPEGITPPDHSEEELRKIYFHAQRHSNATWLRDTLWEFRNHERDCVLRITGENIDNIRFHDPNAYMVGSDESVEWDLDKAYRMVPGLKAVKDEITWWEMVCQVSFTAKTMKEYQGKMTRLRRFLHSINGGVESDSLKYYRRVSDQVIGSFCRASKCAFPWDARRVVSKSFKWFQKLPGTRLRLRKKQRNAPGQ